MQLYIQYRCNTLTKARVHGPLYFKHLNSLFFAIKIRSCNFKREHCISVSQCVCVGMGVGVGNVSFLLSTQNMRLNYLIKK